MGEECKRENRKKGLLVWISPSQSSGDRERGGTAPCSHLFPSQVGKMEIFTVFIQQKSCAPGWEWKQSTKPELEGEVRNNLDAFHFCILFWSVRVTITNTMGGPGCLSWLSV